MNKNAFKNIPKNVRTNSIYKTNLHLLPLLNILIEYLKPNELFIVLEYNNNLIYIDIVEHIGKIFNYHIYMIKKNGRKIKNEDEYSMNDYKSILEYINRYTAIPNITTKLIGLLIAPDKNCGV